LAQEQPLLTLLETFSEKYHIHFSYNPIELYDVQVNFEFDATEEVDAAIERLLSPTRFHYESFGEQFYVIYEKSKAGEKDVRKLRKHWKEIQKLEQKGNLSLRKSNAKNKLKSALSDYATLEKARWSIGKISDATTKETLIGANIVIKGTNIGTASDANGNFQLKANQKPPYDLAISYTGYQDKIVRVTADNWEDLNIMLTSGGLLLDKVVVGASRHSERFVEAPVTVEKLDILALQSSSAEGVFESLSNLKGVQIVKGSISGAVMNTRGFANMNNLRFLMHLDGMDVTSPGFGVYSNTGGVSILDVQSVEVIPGASSALYGANAFNGILLMRSKDPFIHQGLSLYLKTGITSHSTSGVNPYNNLSVRYAKAYGDKFAFKIDYETLLTKDWVAQDFTQRDRSIDPTIRANQNPPLVDANQAHYDAVTIHGDMDAEEFTQAIENGETLVTSNGQSIHWQADNVHRTGYSESELFNPEVSNHRINIGLAYKINSDWRIDYLYKNAVQDLVLRHTTNYPFYNFNLEHHKVELKGKGLTVRWYHNQENARNTWSASYLAASIQTQLLPNEAWKQRFVDAFAGEVEDIFTNNIAAARAYADEGMAAVGSAEWEAARQLSISSPTTFNPDGVIGAKLAENSAFWQAEAFYDFEESLLFDPSWKLQFGASFRKYRLDSKGAFFNDNRLAENSLAGNPMGYAGNIPLSEAGLFGQVGKKLLDNRLSLSFVGRANYHSNFKLNFTPQIAAVFSPDAKRNHNIRTSFTTGVRNPGLQEQYINFLISPAHVILG
ncbi:MAG: carboxypeptidase-like regulatory domain-containing protein, partial [Saprospiraceae bacterium]